MVTASGGGVAARFEHQVEVVLRATQTMAGVIAESLVLVEDVVTLPQFRVLVMVADRGSMSLNEVATGLGVHPSNATRACDRLVGAGLLHRRTDDNDRRRIAMTLTPAGKRLVARVMAHRRQRIATILRRLDDEARARLSSSLDTLTAAADPQRDDVTSS